METNMRCELCNSEIKIYEINKVMYVEICRKCIDSTYKEGFRRGFELAGGKVDKLTSDYKEMEAKDYYVDCSRKG
jgi:hypothetical protein